MKTEQLQTILKKFPFIAITRGILPEEAVALGAILVEAGFQVVETPLNSPRPLKSIELLADRFRDTVIGAGTVLTIEQVRDVKTAGGQVVISPNCDIRVIEETKKQDMLSIPGVATPTEMMTAIRAGADGLKLFPMEMIRLDGFRAMQVVVSPGTLMIPVGGINKKNWRPYYQAGASGFGLGSSLYRQGMTADELKERAQAFAVSWREVNFCKSV
jgi:2-dehydro-3-deoxyphosphogalactonate aldolase